MFRHVLSAVDKGAEQRVLDQVRALHRATTESREATLAAARTLRATIEELLPRVAATKFEGGSLDTILADIEADAARGEFRDYDAAEQAAMAAQSVIVAFENTGAIDKTRAADLHAKLDAVYATLKSENTYAVGTFQGAFKGLRGAK